MRDWIVLAYLEDDVVPKDEKWAKAFEEADKLASSWGLGWKEHVAAIKSFYQVDDVALELDENRGFNPDIFI